MKFEAPSSRVSLFHKVQLFDLVVAALCPPVSLILRDPTIFFGDRWVSLTLYCVIGFISTLVIFQLFGVGRGLSRFASAEDAADVWKAAIGSVALSSAVFFTLTRLDDIPRSAPLIQLVLLGTALSLGRAYWFMRADQPTRIAAGAEASGARIVVYGANRLAWFYIKMMDTLTDGGDKVMAIIDDDPKLRNRLFCGRPILGGLAELSSIVAEYKTHGVDIDHLVIGYDRAHAPAAGAWDDIIAACGANAIACIFLPERLAFNATTPAPGADLAAPTQAPTQSIASPRLYWRFRRLCDCLVAVCLGVIALPLIIVAAIILAFDVGAPLIFWQNRVGQHGRPFHIYKFRTLRAPFDRNGGAVPEDKRLSPIGALMRRLRIDELPQLWNIIRGDMAFIGPRPLLPVDQPTSSLKRLEVPPGITGWAQVHGGKLIGREEKAALDDWYVSHASFWLDLRIMLLTATMVCIGDRRNEQALAQALGDSRARAMSLSNTR